MFIDKNSIIITANGTTINMGQYLVQAQYGYNKLWGEDTGRNLKGDFSGTLMGIFPKLILQFRALDKNELELITPILDAPRQSVTYYDPYKKQNITMTTYTGDYEIVNKGIVGDEGYKNEGFSVSFIAISKRV